MHHLLTTLFRFVESVSGSVPPAGTSLQWKEWAQWRQWNQMWLFRFASSFFPLLKIWKMKKKKMFFKNDFGFFAFIMLVSSVTKSVKCFDILEDILASHKQIGICRIGCLSKLVPLRQDSMCFRHSSCKSCWELCQRFQLDKSDKALLCSQPGGSSSCDDGCQIACKFGQNKVTEQVETPFDLSTNFIGCTLFWKTNRDNHLVTINQLYGMDDQVRNAFLPYPYFWKSLGFQLSKAEKSNLVHYYY